MIRLPTKFCIGCLFKLSISTFLLMREGGRERERGGEGEEKREKGEREGRFIEGVIIFL